MVRKHQGKTGQEFQIQAIILKKEILNMGHESKLEKLNLEI